MYPRARRFGNAYAFAIVDILFSILWFSAWVAIASYVGAGKSAGLPDDDGDDDDENNDNEKKTGCDAFGYGSPGKCKLSTGTVILGVVILYDTRYISFPKRTLKKD